MFRGGHRGLSAAVGLAARQHSPTAQLPEFFDRASDAFPIARRPGWIRRPFWALPPKREIVSQHQPACLFERAREPYQRRRIAIRSGAVGKRDSVARGLVRPVQKSASVGGIEGLFHWQVSSLLTIVPPCGG